ncbi:hypothetical protein Tco_0208947, partial [Tanacetum coccineum]
TLRSDEDRLKLDELMALCTTLQNRVLDLEKTKTTQQNKIASLKRRVKKLEKNISVQDDANKEMFDVDALNGEEVFVARQNENVVEDDKGLSHDKGKGILVEPEKPLKKTDQHKLDEANISLTKGME